VIQLAFAFDHRRDEGNGGLACVRASGGGCSSGNGFVGHSAGAGALGSGKVRVVSSLIGFALETWLE
jgi:hypothetical protein